MATSTRPGAAAPSSGLRTAPPAGPGGLRDSQAFAGVAHPPVAPAGAYTGPPIPPPQGKPIALLLNNGFAGTIADFNQRVQTIHDAHVAAFGTPPSPQLVAAVARSPLPTAQLPGLFSVTSRAQAQTMRTLHAAGIAPAQPTDKPPTAAQIVLGELAKVQTPDDIQNFTGDNASLIGEAFAADPKFRSTFNGSYAKALARVSASTSNPMTQAQRPEAAGLASEKVAREGWGLAGKWAQQIATGLLLGPAVLGTTEVGAVVKSVEQKSAHPFIRTNEQLGKSIVTGMKQDVTHPKDNFGNLLLDILGFASLGYGAAARIAGAGRALAAGEGAAAAARALGTKAATGTYRLGEGADVPLSGNPLVAKVQTLILDQRTKGLGLNETGADAVPTGAAAPLLFEKASAIADGIADPLRKNFSIENKVGRQLRAADRVDRAVRLTLAQPLEQATGSARLTSSVIDRLKPSNWRALSVGEQKGIQVLATDSLDPFTEWRDFHKQMIDAGIGDPSAHRAHLAALDAAEKVVAAPSDKFLKALGDVRAVMGENELLRIDQLGLSPVAAEMRVARVGQTIRGEEGLASFFAGTHPDLRAIEEQFPPVFRRQGGKSVRFDTPEAKAAKAALRDRLVAQERGGTGLEAVKATKLNDRLSELDARYNALVESAAKAEGKPYQGVTAIQNALNAKSIKRGRGPIYTNQSDQLRALGEKTIQRTIEAHPDEPAVRAIVSQLKEADLIRKELTARSDASIGLDEQPSAAGRVNPESHYLPFQSIIHSRRSPTFWTTRPGQFGLPVPSRLPELTHYFTGDSIRAGDFRLDSTGLAAESYSRTVRLATKVNFYKQLHDHYATDEPRTAADIPIRDVRQVSDELRKIVAKIDVGHMLTAEDVANIPEALVADLGRLLSPSKEEAAHLEGVKWVDPRFLADQPQSRPSLPARVFSNINEPLRDATLFLRPAYILNVLNNVQMAGMQEGIFLIPNMLRALKASKWYGPDVARMLDAMAGEGRMRSYAPDVGGFTKASHALAGAWNVVTDQYFRRAAVIHEIRALGFTTSEQITEAVRGQLHDPELKAKMLEASQRAKKAMVEMDNLTAYEKNVLRHVVFVYPWQSRSAVWSLRTIFEHPAQSAIFAEIGKEQSIEQDPVMQHLPGWMKDLGYVPVGTDGSGRPTVINPSSINTFATLSEVAGLVKGDQSAIDLIGPGADLIVRLATERDRFGRVYPHPYIDPVRDVLAGLPQVAAYKRSTQQEPAGKPVDITNIGALVSQEHLAAKRPIRVPGGYWNTYAPLVIGGLAQRAIDPAAVNAKWWATQPWEVRHTHELALTQKMASLQGSYIGKAVPSAVRDGLRLVSDLTAAYHTFTAKMGRTPTTLETIRLDIETLQGLGEVKPDEAATLNENLAKTPPLGLATFRQGLLDKFAGAKFLSDWHRQVALVAQVASAPDFDADIHKLISAKVLPSSMGDTAGAPLKARVQYGRAYLAYDAKVREFAAREKTARVAGKPTADIEAALRVFVDTQDKPVTIEEAGASHTFPPLPRLAIARLTADQMQAHIASDYSHAFATLGAVDKRLMGLSSSAKMTAAWAEQSAALRAYRKANPGVGVTRQQVIDGAAAYDHAAGLGGKFAAEVSFSFEPRWKQLRAERIYTASPHKADWDAVLQAAATESGYLSNAAYDQAALRASWTTFARDQWPAQIESQSPGLWRELQPYLKADPSFLVNLVNR